MHRSYTHLVIELLARLAAHDHLAVVADEQQVARLREREGNAKAAEMDEVSLGPRTLRAVLRTQSRKRR